MRQPVTECLRTRLLTASMLQFVGFTPALAFRAGGRAAIAPTGGSSSGLCGGGRSKEGKVAKITVPLLGISLVVQRLVDVERVSGGPGAGWDGWTLGTVCGMRQQGRGRTTP